MKKYLFVAVLALMSASCSSDNSRKADESLKLWYDSPARQWTDALPLGNGRLLMSQNLQDSTSITQKITGLLISCQWMY